MSSEIIINVVDDFSEKPYGRYRKEDDYSGEVFRDTVLNPALAKSDHVVVILTGYNRYGRSFIDEAFGGLVRECGWTESELRERLIIKHDDVASIPILAWERIRKAQESGG